jgi:signal transduction histidine kinase
VERIIENLVVNAARHTPKGTAIWVRVHRREEGTMILVQDAGPGVPLDLREVIFEPFRHGGEGLGIGLSLVARFATLHGGWARVGDREGGGASFEVFLPDGPVVTGAVPETVELAAP